ncbi:hypothetical protein CERSUDRAFT_113098 [Gelatoporia subvermispora B]|uniref:CRA domain-containing protein n=1 Tax=Ceriporiopsis subvermispora (strain B) TaxID=914234 RepID=M2PNG8_CERS8|nr:hypothetical protein CERSUDRAFT_113098 [Gelatoporia subvermispora B]
MAPPSSRNKARTNDRLFEPTPDDLRLLILDYLCHNSCTNAARAFAHESAVKHLDADGDEIMPSPELGESSASNGARRPDTASDLEERLSAGELRRAIRVHLLSGRIDHATSLLNSYFPSVLSPADPPPVPAPSHSSDTLTYLPSTSVDPRHLALNLRIQAFIEAARTVPLPFSPSSFSSSASTNDGDEEMLPLRAADTDESNAELLRRAHGLYKDAELLPDPDDRKLYIAELHHVGGLLAYPVPETSPASVYLVQERRDVLADQIEAAILYRTGQTPVSKLELATRYTQVMWTLLRELKVKPPQRSAWPPGVSSIPGFKDVTTLDAAKPSGGDGTPAKKPPPDSEAEQTVPEFDLHELIDATPL